MLQSASVKKSAVRATVLDRAAALKAFHFGKFDLAIEANPDGSYTYYYDPARPESVLSRAEIDSTLQTAAGRKDALTTSAQSSSEPGSRYIDFLIPGLLGMNLMNSGMWGVGFALVEMRQRKLLKRFVATPMRRSDFLLALTSSRLILMVIEVGLLLSFGVLVFHMPLQGSIVSVILLGSLGAITFGGVGLLTACRAQKIESVSGLINLVMMPMWIFSGVFFSYDQISRHRSPVHQSAAANRAQRRAASHDHRRRNARIAVGTTARARDLGRGFVHSCAALVSLDLGQLLAVGS
jgi:ABC-2 type transport system permease protein